MVRQQRQSNPGQNQKFAGGDDLLHFDTPRQCVKLFAAGEQKNRRDRDRHADPRRQRQSDGAEQIGEHIEDRHDQPDIGLVLFLMLVRHGRGNRRQSQAPEHHKAAGKWHETVGIEQIKHAAGEREQRKGADAAGPPLVGVREIFLECQPEKEAQAEKQRNACRRWCRDHDCGIMGPAPDPLKPEGRRSGFRPSHWLTSKAQDGAAAAHWRSPIPS